MNWFRPVAIAILLFCAAPAAADELATRDAISNALARGAAAFRAGDIATANEEWTAAIRSAQKIGAREAEAEGLVRRGEAERVAGYLRDADRDLHAALAIAEEVGDEALIAAAGGALGNLELSHQHPEVAEPLLTRSRDLARRLGILRLLASSSNDLGNLYATTNRPDDAARAYAEAAGYALTAGEEVLAGSAEINIARLRLQRHNPDAALVALTTAIDRLVQAAPTYNGGLALVSAGSVALEPQGTLSADYRAAADRAFRAAAAIAHKLNNPTLSSLASGGLGRLSKRNNDLGDAAVMTERAVFAAQNAAAPELLFRWEWQQARLLEQQGNFDLALASYRRAVAELQSVRHDIPVAYRDGRSSFLTTFGPLYLEYSDLLLRRAAAEPARADALRSEARTTIERMKESELQDYFRDSCIADFEARRQSVETIAPGSAILYPISLPDRLELLVAFGQEQQQFTIPVSQSALRGEVQNFRELLEKRTTNEYLLPARQLYDQIIRPIEPALAAHHIDTLVIVPDPVLRIVPFAAMQDGRHFLMERYATAVVPSMQLTAPRSPSEGGRVALILGVTEAVQGFRSLPNVMNEVASVQKLESGQTLLNSGFSKERFAAKLKENAFSIIHIASHGQFSTDPKQTFILAYNGKLTMDELESDIKLGARRDTSLDLLVLSACETASGDDRAALGLAGVALKAGARGAVASLWNISDEASEEFVVDFYRALQSGGLTKARALQSAQKQLLSSEQFSHPAYWAPYLLIGNWL